MEPFKYTYIPTKEIMDNIIYLSNMKTLDILVLVFLLILIFSIVNYIFPFLYLKKQQKIAIQEKDKKREFIKKIALQMEIEDEIEKEIDYLLKS